MSSYQITSQPATEPITTAEAKAHLRVDFADEDTYIDTLIASARKYCEQYTNRVFITQTWRQNEDFFTNPIELKVNPVISLTTLKYYDTNGTQQTVTDAAATLQKDFNSDNAKLYEGTTTSFPSISTAVINPIEAITVCGYGAASDVPEDIKHAIKLMVSHLYENREMINVTIALAMQIEMPVVIKALLAPYRLKVFG